MDIWQEIRKDQECGAKRLVSEYGDRLFSTAALLCPNEADAEELVFRSFEQAIRKIHLYEPRGEFFSWLYTIMLNFRRMDVRKRHPDVVAFGTTADLPEVPISGFIDAISAADAEAVRSAVRGLSDMHRIVTVLKYFEGRSIEEIAEMMQIPIGTVKSRLHHARIALQAALTHKEYKYDRK